MSIDLVFKVIFIARQTYWA